MTRCSPGPRGACRVESSSDPSRGGTLDIPYWDDSLKQTEDGRASPTRPVTSRLWKHLDAVQDYFLKKIRVFAICWPMVAQQGTNGHNEIC